MEGADVREAENFLTKIGLFNDAEDGKFGLLMEESVMNLQKNLRLPVNGVIDGCLLKNLAGCVGDSWGVYRIKTDANSDEITAKVDISKDALRSRGRTSFSKTPQHVFFVPKKEMVFWVKEARTSLACSGMLSRPNDTANNAGESVKMRPVYRADELKSIREEIRPEEKKEWVLDLRSEEPAIIRKAVRDFAGFAGGWFWLSQTMLDTPGMVHYLNLHKLPKRNGIIIELSPPCLKTGKQIQRKRLYSYRHPLLMVSMNLLPRIYINNEVKIVNHKEGRIWGYRRMEKATYRDHELAWAYWRINFEDKEGFFCFADQETIRTLYRRVLSNECTGVILEGVSGFDPRIINLRREYFALENSGHEITVRDIYLKREKMPGIGGHHGAAGRKNVKDRERRRV